MRPQKKILRQSSDDRSALVGLVLALVACAHASSPEGGTSPSPNEPPSGSVAVAPDEANPGQAVLTVVWIDPGPRFAVACGANLFDERQHWLRPAGARGPLTERFMIRAGRGRVQWFVADGAEPRSKWAIFEDDYACAAGAHLRVDLHVEKLPDGQLAVDIAYAGQGCRLTAAVPLRRLISSRPDPPGRICCGHREEPDHQE